MGHCKDCIFWSETGYRDNFKFCESGKMVYDIKRGEGTPIDGIGYMDGEECGAVMWTGPDFGCIHYSKIPGA